MKRRRRRLIRIGIAMLVLAALFAFKEHFNGKFIYFTTGFDRHTLFEAGSQTTYDYEAEILFSDIRSQYEALFGSDVWSYQSSKRIYGCHFCGAEERYRGYE